MSATSTAGDPVQAVVDLLNGAQSSVWTNQAPEVYLQWDVTQRGRETNNNPALYVWSPVEGTFDPLAADYTRLDEEQTIEIDVWTLDPEITATVATDVIQFMSEYGNDNEDKTEFLHLRPESTGDARAEHIARQTDHYITTVTVAVRNLRDTGT